MIKTKVFQDQLLHAPEFWGCRAACAFPSVTTVGVLKLAVVRSLLTPFEQGMQQLWNEGAAKDHDWDQECGSRKWF
ncbi:hypothetical protein VULLAG_LOCUS10898 [Vulpes lagopus]